MRYMLIAMVVGLVVLVTNVQSAEVKKPCELLLTEVQTQARNLDADRDEKEKKLAAEQVKVYLQQQTATKELENYKKRISELETAKQELEQQLDETWATIH